MGSLTGKVALVTGASKGIGAGIAKALAEAGASVVVNYASSREGADRVVAEIKKKDGKAVAVGGDVSKISDVKNLFEQTKKAFGGLDILVNNAGIYAVGKLEDVKEEDFHRQFNTNVLGPILVAQESLKYFGDKGGNIINVGSLISQSPAPGMLVYAATKGALDVVTKTLSKELGERKIRVNSLNPGAVVTEGAESAGFVGGDFHKSIIAQTPLGRIGQPDDIARAAVFLASDDAGWVTGELLKVGGGLQ